MREHPGRRITNDQLEGIFPKAYHRAASVEIACSSFRTSGVYPWCRDIIPHIELNDDKRSNDILHKPDKIESHVKSSTLLFLLSGYRGNFDFNIVIACFSNIVAIQKITLPSKKDEESQIITTSPYRKSPIKSSKKSKKIRIIKTAKLKAQKIEK